MVVNELAFYGHSECQGFKAFWGTDQKLIGLGFGTTKLPLLALWVRLLMLFTSGGPKYIMADPALWTQPMFLTVMLFQVHKHIYSYLFHLYIKHLYYMLKNNGSFFSSHLR